MKKTGEIYKIKVVPFRPCITDGTWLVSRVDVQDEESKKCFTFIFGCDAVEATLYNKQRRDSSLDDLVQDVITEYTSFGMPDKFCYWFEFNGERFRVCKEKPEWANYDCGVIED